MQRIDQLDLYHLPWEEAAFAADPYPYFEAARQKHPWLAKSNAGYVVFELNAIRELLVQDAKLRTSFGGIVDIMGARGSAWGRFAEEQMIALPERDHKMLRDMFASKFTPRYASQLRPIMREVMAGLLEDWAPKRAIDFEEFASYYPVSVMARMIGAPLDAIPALRSAMETMGRAFSMDSRLLPELDQAVGELDAFVQRLIAGRREDGWQREDGKSDLLDMLIEAGDEGGASERQLADLLIFLFVAGYDTSKNVLTYMMHLLVQKPEIYTKCAQDLDYCAKVVEEGLRMFNPSSVFRAPVEDMIYRDVLIPKDLMVFFTLNVAGRVSPSIENPHDFEPERATGGKQLHVGFGMGKHMCLGQHIARVQLQEGIHLIAQKMHHPSETAAPGWRPFPGVWGMQGLPIEFEPA